MTWLLKLYPADWRRRYGAEVEELVAAQPRTLQLVLDLLAGAVDAHVKPQVTAQRPDAAAATDRGGAEMLTGRTGCCARSTTSRKDAFIGAALTIGFALVVAAIMLIDSSPRMQTVGMVMFPGVLAVGTLFTRLRGHSRAAKVVLIGGVFLVLLVIGLLAGQLQQSI